MSEIDEVDIISSNILRLEGPLKALCERCTKLEAEMQELIKKRDQLIGTKKRGVKRR